MDRARKKQKQHLKRKEKRQALRKSKGGGVAKLFAGGELVACYMNADWRERGQAVAFVLRQARDGRLGMATFMIDLWCAGLKDAWGRVGLARDEFEDMVAVMDGTMDGTMDDAPLAEAAAVVAGAIRFARQNGFRLPPHHERWTAFLGELQPEAADLSAFGVDEGDVKLRWVGPLHDLRTRLVGCTLEQFLARPDVEAVTDGVDFGLYQGGEFGDDDLEDDDTEGDEAFDLDAALRLDEEFDATAEVLDGMVERAAASLRQWCFASGRAPEDRIEDALPLVLGRGFASVAEADAPPDVAEQLRAQLRAQEEQVLASLPETERLRLKAAIVQVEQFLQGIDTPQKLLTAFGLPEVEEDDADE